MRIDCDGCAVRGRACPECVVTVLLGEPPGPVAVDPVAVDPVGTDDSERRAIDVLVESGLVPRLYLVALPPVGSRAGDGGGRVPGAAAATG